MTLHGKRGLVVGIANDKSIAWGCARAFRDAGAELAVTWFNDKARAHVEPLARLMISSCATLAQRSKNRFDVPALGVIAMNPWFTATGISATAR